MRNSTTRRILQIIPAPPGWRSLRFELHHPEHEAEQMCAITFPVLCLALVHCRYDDGDTERLVMPIAQRDDGDSQMYPDAEALLLGPEDAIDAYHHDGEQRALDVMKIRHERAQAHPSEAIRLRRPIILVCGEIRREIPFTEPTATASPA